MGMVTHPVSTIEELLALPDDGMRHELLDGVHVVTPAPAKLHQRVVREVYDALRPAIDRHAPVELFMSPADIELNPTTLVQPDIFVVAKPTDPSNDTWKNTPIPALAIEILSPSTASRDRGIKRRLYLAAGVEEYWIVDIDAKLIERWQTDDARPEIVSERLTWALRSGVGGQIDVDALFG